MSNIVQRKRRSSTSELSSQIPARGEVVVDVTKSTIVVGDGATAGGVPLSKESHTHAAATISSVGFMAAADKVKLDALSSAGGYTTIQSNATPLTQRATVNFGTQFTSVDNSGSSRTDITLASSFLSEQDTNVMALILALS